MKNKLKEFFEPEIGLLKEKLKTTLVVIFLMGLIAHASIFLNFYPSHDSLMLVATDDTWQISLGRFMNPLYVMIRGRVCSPWLIGCLSFIYIALGLAFIFMIFSGVKEAYKIIFCGLVVTNVSLISLYATYMHDGDIYALCFLLNCVSVYLIGLKKDEYKLIRNIIGIILFVISMGMYQSYITISIGLFICISMQDIINGESFSCVLKRGLNYLIDLIAGGGLYSLIVKLVLKVSGIDMANSYNGLAQMSGLSIRTIIKLIPDTYLYYFESLLRKEGINSLLITILNFVLILVISFLVLKKIISKNNISKINKIFLSILYVIFPLGLNAVYVLCGGQVYALMTLSFCLTYLLLFLLIEKEKSKIVEMICIISSVVIVCHNVMFSNAAYYLKRLVGMSTQSDISQIVHDINKQADYTKDTPVILVGEFTDSFANTWRTGFEDYMQLPGYYGTSVTYLATFNEYCLYILGHPINLMEDEEQIRNFINLEQEEIDKMAVYPKEGYCRMINDKMVIKLK
ncbi:glucosyltransferase domain-containing protein [uncultured Clostridium sp.]|uniref:glucosyltransferase domain-containing protein n=1 Tax=uncultured Clostridium sp. TaxID=59620 RepID=UPI0026DB530F|nr:glucosyltransferase domain-containing protein [uncultured Clostridium sp.]